MTVIWILPLIEFQVIDVLSKLAGLWVNSHKEIMYSQASQITFICPMVFNTFPLDTQVRDHSCYSTVTCKLSLNGPQRKLGQLCTTQDQTNANRVE